LQQHRAASFACGLAGVSSGGSQVGTIRLRPVAGWAGGCPGLLLHVHAIGSDGGRLLHVHAIGSDGGRLLHVHAIGSMSIMTDSAARPTI
jgi:hypothetical protein